MEVTTALVPHFSLRMMVLTIWNITWEEVSSVTRAPELAPKITCMMSRIPSAFTCLSIMEVSWTRSGQSGIFSSRAFSSTAAFSRREPPEFSKNWRFLPR